MVVVLVPVYAIELFEDKSVSCPCAMFLGLPTSKPDVCLSFPLPLTLSLIVQYLNLSE